jgi:hypothetical protein
MNALRTAVGKAGRYDLAAAVTAEIVAEIRTRSDVPREVLGNHLFGLGHYLRLDHRPAEAEAPLRESLRVRTEIDPRHWNVTKSRLWLGHALLDQKKYAEAEPVLLETYREAIERIAQAPAWEKHFSANTADRLIELYKAANKPDEVKKWEAERAKRNTPPPNPAGTR